MVRKVLLTLSITINFIFITIFAYKIHNNWFEPVVFKLPFRNSVFQGATKRPGLIYFIGDSHTEGFELNEYLENPLVRNRGVWGDLSGSLLQRTDSIAITKPKEIFIMIGVNDIISGINTKTITENMANIVLKIKHFSPGTKIYVQSVLPTNQLINNSQESSYKKIVELNKLYKQAADNLNVSYINLFPDFLEKDKLKKEYSFDGLHMNGNGYKKWSKILKPFLIK